MVLGSPLTVCAIEKRNSTDFVQEVFSAYKRGVPIMLIDQGQNNPEHLVPNIEGTITPDDGGGWFNERHDVIEDDSPAQITFTSGTTGKPKPVVLSYGALANVTKRLIDVMELDSSIREYIGIPVYFSFGLGRVRAIAAVGGEAFIPSNGFDPAEIARMLTANEINAFSAVPTLIRIILNNVDLFEEGADRLKWIEIGSQYMSRIEKETLKEIFPNAKIVQHYGLTEASRSTFLDVSSTEGAALESVGRVTGDVDVELDDNGRIKVRGGHVALGILSDTGISTLVDADEWLTTNDLGKIENGLLYFEGRADDVINVGGVKISPELFDERLSRRLGKENILASARISDVQRGEAIFIAVDRAVNLDLGRVKREAVRVAEEFGLSASGAIHVAQIDEIPRTPTGKVQRSTLAKAFDPSVAVLDSKSGQPQMTSREAEIALVWKEALQVEQINPHQSFFDLGGDSLSAINAILKMERMNVDPAISRQIFEGRTIAEIAAYSVGDVPKEKSGAARVSDSLNVTRGLMVLALIAGHWLPFFLERLPNTETLYYYTNPFLRLGTPSFAIIYGIGLGYYQFPLFKSNPDRMRKNQRINLLVVGGGILILATFKFLHFQQVGEVLTPRWPSTLFFSVLFFYFISISTIGLLFRILSVGGRPVLTCLVLAGALFLVESQVVAAWGRSQTEGFVDLARLMLVAKYNIFAMTGIALIGMAAGLWIKENISRKNLAGVYAVLGGGLVAGGVLLSVVTGIADLWFTAVVSPFPMIVTYAGVVALAFAASLVISDWAAQKAMPIILLRCLAVTGLLSLLLYVSHELVIPGKAILVEVGFAESAALLLTVALFLALWGVAGQRLYRLYYG